MEPSRLVAMWFFFFNDTATTEIYTLSLHDALPISVGTEPRRPLHVVWFIGLSAAIYALDLAAVAAMQAGTDAGVAAQQAPAQAAVDALRAQDASVAQDIQRASTSLQAGATAYAL